ncbi:MAG: hypothetical protein PHO93_02735 [Candidatus Saccharimonadaceae bacterium]|nr:hypothetical protein [Candidatus Saccharimonadaceae bacterium]
MAGNNIVQTIKEKEMDRKEFLKYSGLVLLGLIGLKAVASLLDQNDIGEKTVTNGNNNRGFGGGKYGV